MMSINPKRRAFVKGAAAMAGVAVLDNFFPIKVLSRDINQTSDIPVSGHVWVYASKFPPDWDCTPILDQVFSDFKYAGMDGVELMESNLRNDQIVSKLRSLMETYQLPVTGSSYNADMWNRSRHSEILEDAAMVLERLQAVGGSTFGITVGNARRIKSEAELDAQAEILVKIIQLCKTLSIQPNIHNHTFEVENDMHDLKGILKRIPDIPLGPDINWLIRGGIDPVWFINTYGKQIVYLHLRDQDTDGKWTRALGEGNTDFHAISKALQSINFKGRAAIELAFEKPPENGVREDWKKSREYVRKVFGW